MTELLPDPIARYFGRLMDSYMGPDFEKGLINLKKKVEAANSMAAAVEPLGDAKQADGRTSKDHK